MLYPGRHPKNVNKDAKYSVVHGESGSMDIRLIYRASEREKYLLTTDRHDRLVDLVNAAKHANLGTAGGAFYINEYRHVLVPTPDGCVYAGEYAPSLVFEFDGMTIGPRAADDLEPGDEWPGPHVGIRYTLAADCRDIKYDHEEGRKSTTYLLSDFVGAASAAALARRLSVHKGALGGRIYINEECEFFSPVNNGAEYRYLGHLGDDGWFPCPSVPASPAIDR